MGKIVETNDIEFLGETNVLKATKSANVADVSTTPPAQLAAQTVTTIQEAQTAINNLVAMVNAMQVNEVELKTKLNAKLTADRSSGQQAT